MISEVFYDAVTFYTLSRVEYEEHLNRLDRDSQTFRFGSPTTPDAISMFCDRVFKEEESSYEHVVYGIFVQGGSPAVGHLHIAISKDLSMSEISLGIESEHQGRGLGKIALSNGIALLKASGVKEFRIDCLRRNEKIVRLVKSLGCEVVLKSYGTEISAHAKLIDDK